MGVRMGPSGEGHASQPPGATTGPWWLRRSDLLILPCVYGFDVLVFSRLLRTDITAAERIAILCYSAVGVAILAFRRLAPLVVFGALWLHALAALLVTTSYVPVILLLVALESVAQRQSIKVSLTALATLVVPTGLLAAAAAREASAAATMTAAIGSAVFYTVADVLAWAIGRWARRQRLRLDNLAQQHRLEVEQQRQETEHAVSDERLRIARELHDIVAHSVTIMVLHAAGAKRVVDSDPARAKESLATIEESGQQAMGELRRLLELLRESDGGPTRSGSPLPGLAQLDQLLDTVRGSGVAVVLDTSGEPRRLDASIDLAAYRLIQEGLTNVVKHRGAGARVTVGIEWGAEKVTVAVEDEGAGSSPAPSGLSTGNGLAGLRERIAIAGGDFAAGPIDGNGYRVAARLPVSGPIASGSGGDVPPDAANRSEGADLRNGSTGASPAVPARSGATQLTGSDQ
jgi:signal transduction histidine kinase